MNKQELVDEITMAMKITHCRAVSKTDVNAFLESLASVTQRSLRQEQNITLPGIGKFSQAPQMAGNTIIFAPAKALTITQK
jgi:nucleoid DNA-binding protein